MVDESVLSKSVTQQVSIYSFLIDIKLDETKIKKEVYHVIQWNLDDAIREAHMYANSLDKEYHVTIVGDAPLLGLLNTVESLTGKKLVLEGDKKPRTKAGIEMEVDAELSARKLSFQEFKSSLILAVDDYAPVAIQPQLKALIKQIKDV